MSRDHTLFAKCDPGLHDAAAGAAFRLGIPVAELIRRAVAVAAGYVDALEQGDPDLDTKLNEAFGPTT